MSKRTALDSHRVAVAYRRASKNEQRREAQLNAIEAWAKSEGMRVAAWFIDQGVRTISPIDERPALRSAFAGLREYEAGVLVVAKRDRIARDVMGRIAGSIMVSANRDITEKQIFFRPPFLHATIVLPAARSKSFDDPVPDLSALKGDLCIGATASPGALLTQKCGVTLGAQDLSLELQEPPTISSPLSEGSTLSGSTALSWTAFDNGIYLLELDALPVSPTTPTVFVFQSATTATWPDLGSLGIEFPASASYRCSVAGLGPCGSLEEAFGPTGLGAPFPTEVRRRFSPSVDVTTAP
jgi:Resolvase, N terminal domain